MILEKWTALLLAAGMSVVATAQPPVTDDAVAAIARPEPQLRGMLARTVFSTQTMGMAAYTLGIPEACKVVRPAFEQAVAQALPRWRANLIRAYRTKLPADTLRKAVAAPLAESGALVQPYLEQIGVDMQRDSEPVLREAAAAVLMPALAAASKLDPKKVDSSKRMGELKQAQVDGSLFCGLQATSLGPN